MFTFVWAAVAILILIVGSLFYFHFECKFGNGSFIKFVGGIALTLGSLFFGFAMESQSASQVVFASHEKQKFYIASKNVLNQFVSVSEYDLNDITNLGIETTRHYRRGHVSYTKNIQITVDGKKITVPSDGGDEVEQCQQIKTFLENENSPDYGFEKNDSVSIFWWCLAIFAVGLYLLKSAFFDGGTEGSKKRTLLSDLQKLPTRTENDKYNLIATMYTTLAFDYLASMMEKLPVYNARMSSSFLGAGFFGMGKPSMGEFRLLHFETITYLLHLISRMPAFSQQSEEIQNLFYQEIFEKRVLSNLNLPIKNALTLVKDRLDTYDDLLDSEDANHSPATYYLKALNHLGLHRKLCPDLSQPKPVVGSAAAKSSELSLFLSCFKQIFEESEDLETMSGFDISLILKSCIEGKPVVDELDEDEGEDGLELSSKSTSAQRMLAKLGKN